MIGIFVCLCVGVSVWEERTCVCVSVCFSVCVRGHMTQPGHRAVCLSRASEKDGMILRPQEKNVCDDALLLRLSISPFHHRPPSLLHSPPHSVTNLASELCPLYHTLTHPALCRGEVCVCEKRRDLECMLDFESLKMDGWRIADYCVHYECVCVRINV